MDKTLVIFSIPRTGSNFFCNLINSFKEFECFGEVYHKKSVFAPYKRKIELINYLTQVRGAKEISIGKNDYEDLELLEYIHQHPDFFLESMQQTCQKKYLGFKIFQYHLSNEDMGRILLEKKDIIKVILKRNLLDVYASSLILEENMKKLGGSAAHHFDTSKDKVRFEEEHFSKWLKRTRSYFSMFEDLSHQFPKEYFFVNYEDIHQYNSNKDKALYIIRLLNKIGLKLDLNQNLENLSFLTKQDSRYSVLEKFENPENLKFFLLNNNLENMLN